MSAVRDDAATVRLVRLLDTIRHDLAERYDEPPPQWQQSRPRRGEASTSPARVTELTPADP